MPLLDIWKAVKDSVLKMNLEAIVKIAGDGQLKDGSETSLEFRKFLTEVDSKKLAEYSAYCIDNVFINSGQVLQDVVNEIGRRLGFESENGRYRGVRGEIGYDGIWTTGTDNFIVEVKTTTAYEIELDVIANYRDKLANLGRVPPDSPILIVIGRDKTESLEAQVRGSRHAWSIRIIGIEALIKLMEVNLSTSSKEVTEKIHAILKPIEYTRIDKIVDVIFTATEDKDLEIDGVDESLDYEDKADQKVYATPQSTPKAIIEKKKQSAIEALSLKLDKVLIKKKFSLYSDQSRSVHAAVAISKRYERLENFYWYAYHEVQRQFLKEANTGFMVFGMSDLDTVFAVPYARLEELREKLNSTIREDGREYKHIFIYLDGEKYTMRLKAGEEIDMSIYKV